MLFYREIPSCTDYDEVGVREGQHWLKDKHGRPWTLDTLRATTNTIYYFYFFVEKNSRRKRRAMKRNVVLDASRGEDDEPPVSRDLWMVIKDSRSPFSSSDFYTIRSSVED